METRKNTRNKNSVVTLVIIVDLLFNFRSIHNQTGFMKKNFSILILTLLILAFSSCNKDKPAASGNHINKVKTYTETLTSSTGTTKVTYNFEYDSKDRITAIISASSPDNKFIFNYNSDTGFTMDDYSGGTLYVHENFYLKSSILDSTYQYDNTYDTLAEKYVYNSNNLLSVLDVYAYYYGISLLSRITVYTYDNNGNLVKTNDTNNKVETYDYYPDLVYTMPVLSPKSKPRKTNLVKTYTLTENGNVIGSTTSTYTFDGQNRITSITETANNGTVGTKTFTYFD